MGEPVLASDADREACASHLRAAAGEGRLNVVELEQRLGDAYQARTRLDLARLTADLPEPSATGEQKFGLRRRRPVRRRASLVAFAATANAALLGLWMADVGAMRDPVIFGINQFEVPWPLIPLAVWTGAVAAATGRRRRAEPTTPDAPIAIG